MPTCRRCEADLTPEELVRHEQPRLTTVHCPECNAPLGTYRRHGDDPQTDRRQG